MPSQHLLLICTAKLVLVSRKNVILHCHNCTLAVLNTLLSRMNTKSQFTVYHDIIFILWINFPINRHMVSFHDANLQNFRYLCIHTFPLLPEILLHFKKILTSLQKKAVPRPEHRLIISISFITSAYDPHQSSTTRKHKHRPRWPCSHQVSRR